MKYVEWQVTGDFCQCELHRLVQLALWRILPFWAYSAEDLVEVQNLAHDARNRPTQQQWVAPGVGDGCFRMDAAFDEANNKTSLTYPGGNAGQLGEADRRPTWDRKGLNGDGKSKSRTGCTIRRHSNPTLRRSRSQRGLNGGE